MAKFKKIPQKINDGKISYNNGIVDDIVLQSINEIEGVELFSAPSRVKNKSRSISATFEKDGVHIEVDVKIDFSLNVSDMAFKVQETVRHNVESMTEYKIACVNVNILDVNFKDNSAPIAAIEEKIEEKPEEKAEEKKD